MYEAEFKIENVEHKALLDAYGKLLMSKEDISSIALPVAVSKAIKDQYKDFTIDNVEKIQKEGKTYYQVDLDGKPNDKKIVLSAEGVIDPNQRYWD